VQGVDGVIHLAALIPPLADRNPEYADYVNCGGTEVLVRACEKASPGARFVYSSSVAVYGDRRHSPQITLADEARPEKHDRYAAGKLAAEHIVRSSALDWTIFRLSAIASPDKLGLDPLLFEMPLDTRIEWCTAEDAGFALARAVELPGASRTLFHLAGGPSCRVAFEEYLDRIFDLMGLGRDFLPREAFGPGPFHCGYMDAFSAQERFGFQRQSLEDYYRQVDRRVRWKRPFLRLVRPLIRSYLLARSPYWRAYRSRYPATARRRVRFEWIFAGRRAHQTM
jgi:nucleoside-diphosphate-sugar epimerase